jgi:hypothetical protein
MEKVTNKIPWGSFGFFPYLPRVFFKTIKAYQPQATNKVVTVALAPLMRVAG